MIFVVAQISVYKADPLWELSSFGEAAITVCQAMERLAVTPPSQPRWGSTAPTVDLRRGSISVYKADPLWELSSFGEAAKAVGQAMERPAVPPPSQPRWGSTAPTVDLRCGSISIYKAVPVWELSSFGEAAMAVGQAM
ncbi:hypothetical protein ACVWXR_004541 [Pseudomonas lurida]